RVSLHRVPVPADDGACRKPQRSEHPVQLQIPLVRLTTECMGTGDTALAGSHAPYEEDTNSLAITNCVSSCGAGRRRPRRTLHTYCQKIRSLTVNRMDRH